MQARVSLAAPAFLLLAWMLAPLAHAQDYPSHPIKLVLPQPPGGIIDLISRSLGERLAEQMKQPVIVENMPGANGSLAAGQVVRSVPDGYTLFMAVDTNLVVNPNLYTNLAYDPFRDFAPISVLAKVPLVLVANPKVPANDVRELIAFAKAHPGTLNYASIGLGTQSHLGMELLRIMTGIDINQVSYRGTAPGRRSMKRGCRVMSSRLVRYGGAGEDPAPCARSIDTRGAQGSEGCAVQRTHDCPGIGYCRQLIGRDDGADAGGYQEMG